MVQLSLKNALLRSTMLVGATAFALPAIAQVTPGTPAAGNAVVGAVDTAAPNPEGEREITVTGSLIKNPNLVRATPVIVTTSEEIELKQSNVAEDVLREIPGVVPNVGSSINNGNGGASLVDLRGIGSKRNLVLLNGNRIVPATLAGEVDLNDIPLALVDRVESLTGAASTTYGADAISGVVNFITKQNFTGVDLSGSEQITEKGDGNYYRTDLTIGGNFADDKGNAVLSVGYQHSDPVYQGDRSYSTTYLDSFTGGASGSGNTIPARFTGTRPIDPATGQPSVDPTVGNGGVRQINPATGQAIGTFARFNYNPYNLFQTPFKRFNIFAQAKYDVSDSFSVYTRGLFSKNTVDTIIAPSGLFASAVTIPLDNPYLPAALRNQFCAFNTSTLASGLYTPLFTPAQCAAAATATGPTDPNYQTVSSNIQRRVTELGPRISDYVTTVFDYRIGARGKFGDHLDWDVNAAYGESSNLQRVSGYTLTSRFQQSILAANTTSCFDTTNGCVPSNPFGPAGAITAAQLKFLSSASTTEIRTQLGQVHAQLSGDFGVTSPAATDPVSFAVGAEYRNYKASQDADITAQTVGELGGGTTTIPFNGGYNVKEGFGELVVPLIQDKPGFQSLTVEGGVRYSAYQVNAPGSPKYNTTTYKGGASYEPGFGLKFRGNYSHAVRAPNINELFSPLTPGLVSLNADPCAGAAPLTNDNLRAVCLAQGAPAGSIGNIVSPTAGQANDITGGNVNLKPETANTYTLGVVFAPTFFPGFSTTVDYYHIKVTGAITNPTSGDVINSCFGSLSAASASSAACTSITRDKNSGGLDGDPRFSGGLPLVLSNLGKIETQGIDVTLNYSRDVGFAKLGLSFLGNYTDYNRFQATPTSINRNCVGYISTNCGSLQPRFQWSQRSTLSFDSFDVSLLWRHINKFQQEPLDVATNGNVFPGFGHIKPYDYFDLSTRISVLENLSLTLTVQNLGDRKPPIVGSSNGDQSFNSGNTYPATYDTLGRRYAVSARVKF